MTTRVATTPLDFSARHVAYNTPHTLMAAADGGDTVATWQRDGDTRTWVGGSSWSADGLEVTCLCWAPPEFGNVLCAGTMEGAVCVWAQAPDGEWRRRARLTTTTHPATAASFAPRQLGPIVAVAFKDGSVRTFIAAETLDAESWDVAAEVLPGRGGVARTCLAWREHDAGLPPLLCVGSSSGSIDVMMFRAASLGWEAVARLGSAGEDYSGQAIGAVAWAPTLGRPMDLLAVAAGRRVIIWALRGAVDALQAERVAVLEHDAGVWQLGWNMLGNWLAASTEAGEVCMWRPDLAGEWLLLNKVTSGGAGAAGGDAAMS